MATLTRQEDSRSVDWQTTKQTMRDRIAFLFSNSLISDIKFVVTDSQHESDGTQVRVPAHKLVLAIISPVFEAMFYGDLAEKGEEIELPDTESHYLIEFLRFLYCEEVCLTTDNAFGVLYLAEKYIVPFLADKCWSFIDENTCTCLKSDTAVSTLNNGILASLVKRDTLHVTKELDLFDAVTQLAEASCKAGDLEPTGEAVRATLGEALFLIRFPTMAPQDFARQVVPRGILTDKEVVNMYQYYYRVISARDIKFSDVYRPKIFSNALLHECCREVLYSGKKSWTSELPAINESLDFVVDSGNVHLKGVHLIATGRYCSYPFMTNVRLVDEDGNELTAKTGYAFADHAKAYVGEQDTYGIVIKFQDPVLICKSSKYTLHVKLGSYEGERMVQKLNTNFLGSVTVSKVTFTFQRKCCSIYKLLFYKLD